MEHLQLTGVPKLENNVILINNSTLRQLVDYINMQTDAITELLTKISNTDAQLSHAVSCIKTNSKHIKDIAHALEGVYKNG